jgi:hypothetical protein
MKVPTTAKIIISFCDILKLITVELSKKNEEKENLGNFFVVLIEISVNGEFQFSK